MRKMTFIWRRHWARLERGQSRRIACFPFLIGLNLFNQLEEWSVHAHQSMQTKYAILRDPFPAALPPLVAPPPP